MGLGKIRAEFHCHSHYSKDSGNTLPELIARARDIGLQRLAITDHNTIAGALEAHHMAPELIVVGEEILTERGELLGYYLQEEVPKSLSVEETLRRLKAQCAFIAIPHPFDVRRHGWQPQELLELLPEVDALETINARCWQWRKNAQAIAFAHAHAIPQIAGSDAHSLAELDLVHVELPLFHDADSLRESVRSAEISGRLLSLKEHLDASASIAFSKIKNLIMDGNT